MGTHCCWGCLRAGLLRRAGFASIGLLKSCKLVLLHARVAPCRSGTPDYQGIIDHYSNHLGYTVLILKRCSWHPVPLFYALSNHPTNCGVARQPFEQEVAGNAHSQRHPCTFCTLVESRSSSPGTWTFSAYKLSLARHCAAPRGRPIRELNTVTDHEVSRQ